MGIWTCLFSIVPELTRMNKLIRMVILFMLFPLKLTITTAKKKISWFSSDCGPANKTFLGIVEFLAVKDHLYHFMAYFLRHTIED